MENQEVKKVNLTLDGNQINVVLNALDQLSRNVGIVNKEGTFDTGRSAFIINTATDIINQASPQLKPE